MSKIILKRVKELRVTPGLKGCRYTMVEKMQFGCIQIANGSVNENEGVQWRGFTSPEYASVFADPRTTERKIPSPRGRKPLTGMRRAWLDQPTVP